MDERPRKRLKQYIGDFPLIIEDILATVFTFLHPGNLFYTKQVCKIWHKASYNDRVLTRAVCNYFDVPEANLNVTNINTVRTLFNTFCFRHIAITRYLEEYQQVPIAIQEDDKDNIRLRATALSNLYNAAKLEWQRAFMQKYWTATSAAVACEELLNEPREKADSHKEFFSNILPNISIEGAKYNWGYYYNDRPYQSETVSLIIFGSNGNWARVNLCFSGVLKYGYNNNGDLEEYKFTADLGSLVSFTSSSLVLAEYFCWDRDDLINEEGPFFYSLNQARNAVEVEFFIRPQTKAIEEIIDWLGLCNRVTWKQFYIFLRAIMANPDAIYPPSDISTAVFNTEDLSESLIRKKAEEEEVLRNCTPSILYEMKRLELWKEVNKIFTSFDSPFFEIEEQAIKLDTKAEIFKLINRIRFTVWEEAVAHPCLDEFDVSIARFMQFTVHSVDYSKYSDYFQLFFSLSKWQDKLSTLWKIRSEQQEIPIDLRNTTYDNKILDKYTGFPENSIEIFGVEFQMVLNSNITLLSDLINELVLSDLIIIILGLHRYVQRIERHGT